jgi:anti-sigma regulatory factor (Ser/Thr protein kinase)
MIVLGSDLSGNSSGESFAFVLDGGSDAGGEARRALVAGDGELPAEVRADVLLLLTELVTNAVRHGGVGADEHMQVEVQLWPRRVRVEVIDPGIQLARVRARLRSDGSGGWGLVLVDRIAARWGVTRATPGTCVWFELDFPR